MGPANPFFSVGVVDAGTAILIPPTPITFTQFNTSHGTDIKGTVPLTKVILTKGHSYYVNDTIKISFLSNPGSI